MTTYNLNLSSSYCSHWGLWESIREILQNGEDELTLNPKNEINVEYDEKNQKLIISNKESILERKTLLLGCTSKENNEKLIGKFGEGYKIALLILTKLGKNVVIKNYMKNERWTPELKADRKYDNEKVLKVLIKKYLFKGDRDSNLTWEVNGITKEEWDEINLKYLRYQDLGETFTDRYGSQILLDQKFQGCVFVNGLFVEKVKSKMAYGYNFSSSKIDLDRDRKTVESFSFFFETKNIINEYGANNPEKLDEIFDLIESEENYKDFQYVLDKPSESWGNTIANKCKDRIRTRFEKGISVPSYPVVTEQEKEEVLDFYPTLNTRIVSRKMKNALVVNEKYSCLDSFVSDLGGEMSEQVLTPRQQLQIFMNNHVKSSFNDKLVKDFKKLLKASENWEIKEPEVVELEDLEKEIEEDIQDINNEVSKTNDNIEEEKSSVEFDDDIPF